MQSQQRWQPHDDFAQAFNTARHYHAGFKNFDDMNGAAAPYLTTMVLVWCWIPDRSRAVG